MTRADAAEIVAMLTAAFPDARWSDATCQLYEQAILDLDVQVARAATLRLIATSRFRPTVAELRDAAADVAVGERRRGADAWGDVVQAIRRFGSYRTPVFDDPITARVVEALGWRNLCLSESPEASDRARFIELYEAFSESARRELVSTPGRIQQAAQLPARGGVGQRTAHPQHAESVAPPGALLALLRQIGGGPRP